jgi:hypothetical protein
MRLFLALSYELSAVSQERTILRIVLSGGLFEKSPPAKADS